MTKINIKDFKTQEEKNIYIENNLLDEYEKELLNENEKGKFQLVKNQKEEKERIKSYFKITKEKKKAIHIRPSASDIFKIKVLASEKGIPYQTYINSILHQVATGNVKI